jgi:hypothetical protein
MPEPETNKPGERGNQDYGTPVYSGHDSARKDSSAELTANPSEEETAVSETAPEPGERGQEEAAESVGLSEFAEDVVSGLEHAGLDAEESETFEQADGESGKELPGTSEAFLAEWGSFGTGPQSASPGQEPTESFIRPESPAPSLNALSRMGLAGYAEAASTSTLRTGKHEELADAVQSALLSIYGEAAHQSAERDYSNAALGDDASSGMSWNKGLKADFAPSNGDDLSPQDVILNYFDYSPGGNGSAPSAHGRASHHEGPVPQFVRGRPEPAASQQRNWAAQDYPAYRPERGQAEIKTGQYDGPPSFSFPVPAAAPARAGGRTGHESSKLLGAAAIGLMGGIAIAASLAAFLIYGPRPASVEIPGIGNLRLDKDEQGYGQAGQEETGRDLQKVATVKSGQEFTSELLAADMAATPGQPAPLSISVRSQQPFEKTLVSISGLPEGGRLNAGVDTGGGNWLLPPRRLSGLSINLPVGAPDNIPIQVQLLDSNARTPLSGKTEFVIRVRSANSAAGAQIASAGPAAPALRPAQAPSQALTFSTQTLPPPQAIFPASGTTAVQTASPRSGPTVLAAPAELNFKAQTVPAPAPPAFQASLAPGTSPAVQEQAAVRRANPRPEVEDLIREGNKRMREGDILEARQFYQKAVALGDAAGDAEASLAMGRSYDPIYFARIDKKNAEPDAAKAFEWYRKARDAGAAQTAMVRIENLKHFLNE